MKNFVLVYDNLCGVSMFVATWINRMASGQGLEIPVVEYMELPLFIKKKRCLEGAELLYVGFHPTQGTVRWVHDLRPDLTHVAVVREAVEKPTLLGRLGDILAETVSSSGSVSTVHVDGLALAQVVLRTILVGQEDELCTHLRLVLQRWAEIILAVERFAYTHERVDNGISEVRALKAIKMAYRYLTCQSELFDLRLCIPENEDPNDLSLLLEEKEKAVELIDSVGVPELGRIGGVSSVIHTFHRTDESWFMVRRTLESCGRIWAVTRQFNDTAVTSSNAFSAKPNLLQRLG